jgi:hypothetical protein
MMMMMMMISVIQDFSQTLQTKKKARVWLLKEKPGPVLTSFVNLIEQGPLRVQFYLLLAVLYGISNDIFKSTCVVHIIY